MTKIYTGVIIGGLILRPGDDARGVTSVGGYVYAWEDAQIDLSACTSVGGSVYVREGAQIDLSACTSVGGYALPDPETARARLVDVARHALADHGAGLRMNAWHTKDDHECETAHCVSGWAARLNGDVGRELEEKVGHPMTGNILLGIEASKLFFLDDDAARAALHKVLEDADVAVAKAE